MNKPTLVVTSQPGRGAHTHTIPGVSDVMPGFPSTSMCFVLRRPR